MDTQMNKEVYFERYCKTCEYANLDETKQPCSDCLDESLNWNTHRPVKYEKKD